MNFKESLRNTTTFLAITAASIYCGREDTAQEVTITPHRPSPTSTPERQIAKPTITLEPSPSPVVTVEPPAIPTSIPTFAPTPTFTPIPTVAPLPTRRPAPTPTVIIIREPAPTKTPEIAEAQNYEWAQRLIDLTNQVRIENLLSPLSINSSLMTAAQKYAKFLFENGDPYSPSHTLDGLGPYQRVVNEGYTGRAVLEVAAGSSVSADQVMESWLLSPPHHDGLLNTEVREIGAGCYEGPYTFEGSGVTIRLVFCVENMGIPE